MLELQAAWLEQHSGTLTTIALLSFLLLIASLLATPWILAKLPANYFVLPPKQVPLTTFRVALSIIKTAFGLLLIMAGFMMFFTPGPGLVSVVLGIALCEFPGKHSLLKRVIRMPSVFSALNWIRAKAKKPPFELPPAS